MSAAGGSLSCTLTVGLSLEGPPVSGTEAREPQVPEKEEHHLARASEDAASSATCGANVGPHQPRTDSSCRVVPRKSSQALIQRLVQHPRRSCSTH